MSDVILILGALVSRSPVFGPFITLSSAPFDMYENVWKNEEELQMNSVYSN